MGAPSRGISAAPSRSEPAERSRRRKRASCPRAFIAAAIGSRVATCPVPAPNSQANSIFAIAMRVPEMKKPAETGPQCSGSRSYWTTHSMFEPALMLLVFSVCPKVGGGVTCGRFGGGGTSLGGRLTLLEKPTCPTPTSCSTPRSEEHTSELQSHSDLVCRLLLEKKK